MDTNPTPVNRLLLRGVLHDVSPLVARVLSVPDNLELTDLHDVFLAMLDWDYDPDFIIRIHAQEFNSFRRKTRGKQLRDFQLRRQEKLAIFTQRSKTVKFAAPLHQHIDARAGQKGDNRQFADELTADGQPSRSILCMGFRLMLMSHLQISPQNRYRFETDRCEPIIYCAAFSRSCRHLAARSYPPAFTVMDDTTRC